MRTAAQGKSTEEGLWALSIENGTPLLRNCSGASFPIRLGGSLSGITDHSDVAQRMLAQSIELAQANADLATIRERFELVNAAASESLWDMTVVAADPVNLSNEFWWSERFRTMLGFTDENDFPNVLGSWANCLHPNDRERTLKAFADHMNDRTGHTPYDIEYQLQLKNGSYRWFRARGSTLRDAQGIPLRVAGSLADISVRKAQEAHICAAQLQADQKTAALIEIKEQMRIEAERRNHEKSHFLANAVHDLRQPIQAIGNALEPLKCAVDSNNILLTHMLIDLAQAAASLMRQQLSAILEISRLESGFVQPELSGIDIISIVNDIVEFLIPVAAQDKVKITFSKIDGEIFIVKSDKQFLNRIFNNIISNGIKYHNDKKTYTAEVKIIIKSMPTCIRVDIEDNGIGIPREYLENNAIFKPFFQLHNRRHENEKGVGLGLSIVNAMLALLPEHRLTVHSIVDSGTTFSLELPRAQALTAIPELVAPATDASALPQVSNLHGKYLLLVEDDPFVRVTTAAMLSNHGILTECATSLSELEQVISTMERSPDLILSDYRLPDGKTALDVARAVEATFGPIPFLILTAGSFGQNPTEPGCGFPVLRKPIASVDLLHAINTMLHAAHDGVQNG